MKHLFLTLTLTLLLVGFAAPSFAQDCQETPVQENSITLSKEVFLPNVLDAERTFENTEQEIKKAAEGLKLQSAEMILREKFFDISRDFYMAPDTEGVKHYSIKMNYRYDISEPKIGVALINVLKKSDFDVDSSFSESVECEEVDDADDAEEVKNDD